MSEEKKDETQNQDERLSKMAAEIGRLKIEALAQKAGAVDAAKVAELVSKNTKADIDAGGTVQLVPVDETGEKLRNADGTPMTVAQYVNVLKASPDTGYYFHDGAASKPSAKTPGGFDVEVNPWAASTWNLTLQGTYMRSDPALAAKMKAAAEGSGVSSNPFVKGPGFNLTRQAAILKENRELGERLRAEAKPPENPFLKSQMNLTRQVLLIRSNPTLAAKLQAEALAIDGPEKPKQYVLVPPRGSFKKMGIGR